MPTEPGIFEIASGEVVISNGGDVLGLIYAHDEDNFILARENITAAFFDLSSGIAGDVVQKLVNYRRRIAIVGDFTNLQSKSLNDFIYESNKGQTIFFVATREDAIKKLSR